MERIKFEWDDTKNRLNNIKHGISFEEAETAFYDENARLMADPEHSIQENRFILLGYNQLGKLLIVIHCYRQNNELIRIISARKANKLESKQYFSFGGNNYA